MRNVSLFELEILAQLGDYPSLRALGRNLNIEPPHLSKIIQRMERKLSANILKRSPKGIILSPDGQRLAKLAEKIVAFSEKLTEPQQQEEQTPKLLSIASSRFLSAYLLAPSLGQLKEKHKISQLRLLDMSPNEVVAAALKNACDAVVSVGEPLLSKAWANTRLGEMTWALYASRMHPLPLIVSEKAVLPYPFLVPTYWTGTHFESGDDYCPLKWKTRRRGDESSSILTAVEIIENSPEQLVFAPRIVMQTYFQNGEVKEIRVREWTTVKKPVFLSVHAGTVSKGVERDLVKLLEFKLV